MGHDIIAIKKSSDEKIANLRIGAFNRHKAHILYESLDANDADGGVSGLGVTQEFTEIQLAVALSKFKYIIGEPKEDLMEQVRLSAGTLKNREFSGALSRLLRIKAEDVSHDDSTIDENTKDVLKFLSQIQNKGTILISFN